MPHMPGLVLDRVDVSFLVLSSSAASAAGTDGLRCSAVYTLRAAMFLFCALFFLVRREAVFYVREVRGGKHVGRVLEIGERPISGTRTFWSFLPLSPPFAINNNKNKKKRDHYYYC